MSEQTNWFREVCKESGSAFSLQIKSKCHEEQTPYQLIEIYETVKFGYLMTIDGFIMLTSRDNYLYHEMMSHPVLFTHALPERVAIIGGGDCGTLKEVLKHDSVKEVHQIEIDERVTSLASKYFPELTENNDDPRVTLLFEDGIKWMAEADDESKDVIIVDSTDPLGPAVGLFNESFYRNCKRVLTKDGLLVVQGESPFLHKKIIKEIHDAMQNVGFEETRILHFPQPCYPSGWWSATMAAKQLGQINHFREEVVNIRPFSTQHYNAEIHRACMAVPEGLKNW